MNQQEVMESSTSEPEWNQVKKAFGGYPDFWFATIIQSGLCDRVSKRWGGTGSKITIRSGP
jgi:hypothetical protein